MDLVVLVLMLAVIGFLVWLIITKIPMPEMFKIAIQIIVVIAVILYLIRRFGGSVPNVLN
jgi:hypothetical protein